MANGSAAFVEQRFVTWGNCVGNQWCPLLSVNLGHPFFNRLSGVYIIWHGGSAPRVVYVGMGDVAARLQSHRSDPWVNKYIAQGLWVTWATVAPSDQPGVERYLAELLEPLEGQKWSAAAPIKVNLPW